MGLWAPFLGRPVFGFSNVDPGLINPSHYQGGVPSKSDESPLKGDTPLLINQGFINPGLTLRQTRRAGCPRTVCVVN